MNPLKIWKRAGLLAKLTFSLVISISLAVFITVALLRNMSVRSTMTENRDNLQMVTVQVAKNFSEFQQNMADSAYNSVRNASIPQLLKAFNENPMENRTRLQYALFQAISDLSQYDFIMLRTPDGQTISSNTLGKYSSTLSSSVPDTSKEILDGTEEDSSETYRVYHWYRSKDGEIFLLKDLYTTNPLTYVGRMIVHYNQAAYQKWNDYTDMAFYFFDHNGNYFISADMSLSNADLKQLQDAANDESAIQQELGGKDYLSFRFDSSTWTTIGLYSLENFQKNNRQSLLLSLLISVVSILSCVALVMLMTTQLRQQLNILLHSMQKVAQGDLAYRADGEGSDDVTRLIRTFNYMTDRISKLMQENLEKEKAKKTIEYQMLEYKYRSLEMQIEPHFIYNALESVNALAKTQGNQEIQDMTRRISKYFRHVTQNSTKQFISVEEEFQGLQDYAEIYRYISGNDLTTSFHVREAVRNAMIPTMILQPIVENALIHTVRKGGEHQEVIVHAYRQEGNLIITVKDSGGGIDPEVSEKFKAQQPIPTQKSTGIGITNVRERLSLIYGDDASMQLENREEGGAKVTISIPYNYNPVDSEEKLLEEELSEL